MEDVKEHEVAELFATGLVGFNPCFNGRCKRTVFRRRSMSRLDVVSILVLMEDVKELWEFSLKRTIVFLVSILVLMEDVKEPCWKTTKRFVAQRVSILVLMEDVKEPAGYSRRLAIKISFNPCFNGRCKRTFR